ncbi:unnamed protein product [Cunninghamella echinulata]
MSNGVLVKAKVNDQGVIQELKSYQFGDDGSGIHGLFASKQFPGRVWITLQARNEILLIDTKVSSMGAVEGIPIIEKISSIPENTGGIDPHYVGEYSNEVWSSLQNSDGVLRMNYDDPTDFKIFPTSQHPVFVAQHPINHQFYASEDKYNQILKIDAVNNITSQYSIPDTARGQTPVGLIAGPRGLWFTLLGTPTDGTGTFGLLNGNDQFEFFHLTSEIGATASILHLAFDNNAENNHVLWLLSSSIVKNDAVDAIFKVTFDDTWTTILLEEAIQIPAQGCWAHRLLSTSTNLFATELTSSKSLGVQEYDPKVVQQLLEFAHRYTVDVFQDALVYAEHANKPDIDLKIFN